MGSSFRDQVVAASRQGSPLVTAVAAKLADMIRSQTFPDGKGLPSERRLSMDLEVSRGVVRAAIKELAELGLVESKPRCRPVVRVSRSRPVVGRRHIGIWLWPNTADYAAASILKGIQRSHLGSDVRLVIGHAAGRDWESRWESEARFLRTLAEDPEEAGAIVWYLGGERNLADLRRVRDAGVPIVFIDRLPPKAFVADYVGTNNQWAAETGVRHLIELGHRRVALVTNLDQVSSVFQREQGYRAALDAAGIRFDPCLVQRDSVDEPEGV